MNEIRESQEWHDVLDKSKDNPLFVLKHSATCPISLAAYRAFESSQTELAKHFLIVQDSRSVSNEIENDLGVRHQSPQLFLVKDGKSVWDVSHYDINDSNIKKAVANIS